MSLKIMLSAQAYLHHAYINTAKSRNGPIPVLVAVSVPIPVIIESIDISNLMYQIPDYTDTQN